MVSWYFWQNKVSITTKYQVLKFKFKFNKNYMKESLFCCISLTCLRRTGPSHCEDFFSFMDESGELFNSFISMDPVGSPPIWQEHGLYRTMRFCGVLVALGFLLPARSFTSKGTSSTEYRMDKPRIFGFDFRGAAVGAFAPIGWGLFGEGGIFPCFS